MMRAVPEVKETVNLPTQYMKAGYDAQAFIARLAEIASAARPISPLRALFDATYFAGLHKAGVPEE
jgi:hypothetical protein